MLATRQLLSGPPRTPKRTRRAARTPQGLQEVGKTQRRESADFDCDQEAIEFSVRHKLSNKEKIEKGALSPPRPTYSLSALRAAVSI